MFRGLNIYFSFIKTWNLNDLSFTQLSLFFLKISIICNLETRLWVDKFLHVNYNKSQASQWISINKPLYVRERDISYLYINAPTFNGLLIEIQRPMVKEFRHIFWHFFPDIFGGVFSPKIINNIGLVMSRKGFSIRIDLGYFLPMIMGKGEVIPNMIYRWNRN